MISAAAKSIQSRIPKAAVSEISFRFADGIKIAGQRWTREEIDDNSHFSPRKILCLHGWMDNCRSFHYLAPNLASHLPDTEVVAIDLPGHGWSSHKSADGPPMMVAEASYYVAETVNSLNWNSFTLIGHSMGAAISVMYAAAFPEQVQKMVLLDGFGPLVRDPSDVSKHLRLHIERRLKQKDIKPPRVYPSIHDAVETRRKTATMSPGKQYLSEEAALELVRRATIEVGGGVQFLHDPRLQWPSLQYFTIEQTEALYRHLKCPTCLITGKDGWPFDKDLVERAKLLIKPTVDVLLPGSHHLHADPDTSDVVLQHILSFLDQD